MTRLGMLVFAVGLGVLSGCIRARTIPDEKLVNIFCDMYIANAYLDEHAVDFGGRRSVANAYNSNYIPTDMSSMDSLNFYEPILRSYGYRSRDFVHTLANFSKRKSARIGDIIERAIKELSSRLNGYEQQVAVRERLDSIACARTSDTVVVDAKLRAKAVADTAKLKLVYPAENGRYRIEYSYMLDTLDVNYGQRLVSCLRDSVNEIVSQNTYMLLKGVRTRRSIELVSSSRAQKLELKVAYNGSKITRPNLDMDSIVVIHYLPIEEARAKHTDELLNFKAVDFKFEYVTD